MVRGLQAEGRRGGGGAVCVEALEDRRLLAVEIPQLQWQRTLGAGNHDVLTVVQQTKDGGYIVGGRSASGVGGSKKGLPRGGWDYWVVKLDSSGARVWDQTYGGSGTDYLTSLQQTSDGGYILGGYSKSPADGYKSSPTEGGYDYWIVKIDSAGKKTWDRSYGGDGDDRLYGVVQATDGGYLLAGSSTTGYNGTKTSVSRGKSDFWVVKTDANGAVEWDKSFGAAGDDQLYSLAAAKDGGYLLGGTFELGNFGYNFGVVKITAAGERSWESTFGGAEWEILRSVQQTSDGGFILGGVSNSPLGLGKTSPWYGGYDYWVVKIDSNGRKTWETSLGGSAAEQLDRVIQTSDGGYVVAGRSNGYWMVKLDDAGKRVWDDVVARGSQPCDVRQTTDGGFIFGATAPIKGNNDDYWVTKLSNGKADVSRPTATMNTKSLSVKSGTTPLRISVTYTDDMLLKASSINSFDIRIGKPAGVLAMSARLISKTPAGNTAQITAVYDITAPGGKWDKYDNGVYVLWLDAHQVCDAAGKWAYKAKLGTFTVALR